MDMQVSFTVCATKLKIVTAKIWFIGSSTPVTSALIQCILKYVCCILILSLWYKNENVIEINLPAAQVNTLTDDPFAGCVVDYLKAQDVL